MDYRNFKSILSKLEQLELGGLETLFELAPKIRLPFKSDQFKPVNPKKAAVLALFYPNKKNEMCFLLTLRAHYNGTHASQISFPGGKIENKDESLENAALRETHEEVGIYKEDVMIIRQMTDTFIPPSNFLVTPFLGFLDYVPNFKPNKEVQEIIEIKMSELMDDKNISETTLTTSYATDIKVPCFKFEEKIVWGATAMMLNEIKDILKRL